MNSISDKKPEQPVEVLDTWVRLVMYHQGKSQGDVAVVLGVSGSTLSKWRKGLVLPETDWLLQKLVHGREPWVRLMAWGVLRGSLPEVFVDADLCAVMVDLHELGEMAEGMVVAGMEVEVPWA